MDLVSQHEFAAGSRPSGLVVRKYRLPNGLGVIVCADPSAPMIAYQTWVRVGSRHEFSGKTGLAHLFEHLMFNQTEQLAPGEFDRQLEAMGADTNAGTWFDWTYYHENIPCRRLGEVMRLEADRFAHLVLEDPQVESEKQVVTSERRATVEDDTDGFLDEQLYALAFERHPYRSPTIGWMPHILTMTTSDARSFYRTYYAPNNATIVLSGGLVEAEALDAIERHYGGLEPQAIPEEITVDEPPQSAARRASFPKHVAADRLLVGWPGCGLAHVDQAALQVAVEMLAGGPSSRLYRRLVVKEEITASVDMDLPKLRDAGLVELRVNLEHDRSAGEAEKMIAEEIEQLASAGPSEAELGKARCRLEAGHWRSLRHPEGKARLLGHYDATVGDFRHLFRAAENIQAVVRDEVGRVARQYLAPHRCSVVVATPRKA